MPVAPRQELVEIPVVEETVPAMAEAAFRPVAIVRAGGIELSLTNAFSPRLMKHLKELLADAE